MAGKKKSEEKEEEEMISTRKAASMMGIKRNTLTSWINQGTCPVKAYRIGSVYRFNIDDIKAYLNAASIPAGSG